MSARRAGRTTGPLMVPKIAAFSRQNQPRESGQRLPVAGRPTFGNQLDDGARTVVSLLPSFQIITAIPPSITLPAVTTRSLYYVPLPSPLGTLTTVHLIHHLHHPCHCHARARPPMFHLSYLMRKIPILFPRTRTPLSDLRHTTPLATIHISHLTFLIPRMSFPLITPRIPM